MGTTNKWRGNYSEESWLKFKKKKHKVSFLTPKEFITIPCPTYPEIRLSINVFQKYLKKNFNR